MDSSPSATKPATKKPYKHPTWEHPKRSGIRIAEIVNSTGTTDARRVFGKSFRVIVPSKLTGGKRETQFFNDRADPAKAKADAQRWAEDRFLSWRKLGHAFAEIPVAMQQEAVVAWRKLVDAKLTDPETGGGFVKAVEAAIRYLRPAGGSRTFAEVAAEMVATKTLRVSRGDLRQDTLDDFKSRTDKIAQEFGERPIAEITPEEIVQWLERLSTVGHGNGALSPTTVFNFRGRLRDVFTYAVEKRFCAENTVNRLSREDVGALGGSKPRQARIDVLTPSEARGLLHAAKANPELGMLPSIILRLFCGLRTKELVRLSWRDIRWQEAKPHVHLSSSTTKTRDVRNVELCPAAVEWLALCPNKTGSVSPLGPAKGKNGAEPTDHWHCRQFTKVRAAAKEALEDSGAPADQRNWSNITRHSFASYHLALHDSTDRTKAQLGHSTTDMLFRYYRSLVSKTDAETYFSISPSIEDTQVTNFPKAATA